MRPGVAGTTLLTVLVGLLVLALPGVAHAASVPGSPPPPDADPFYTAPASLVASSPPGTVLKSRPVSVSGPVQAASSAAHQLLYRTTSAAGQPVSTVTTVLVPSVPAAGPRDLVSYQTAEDSLSTMCAPSYTLRTGSSGQDEQLPMADLLASGWDVVVPDYEGPRSEYTAGPLNAYATLDSIRAAESFAPAGLDGAKTPVGMAGYSGGGFASAWANALQPSYAPELHAVADTAGGIAADLAQNLPPLDGSPFFGTIVAAAIGVDRAYPQFDLDGLLNAQGRTLAQRDGADADGCGGAITNTPLGHIFQYTHYPKPRPCSRSRA